MPYSIKFFSCQWSLLFVFVLFITLGSSCGKDTEPENGNNPTPEVYDLNIPQVSIHTNGISIKDEPKINATMTITDYNENDISFIDYQGNIGIEYRGSTSQTLFDKKSYGLETRDDMGADLDVSILGLPMEEDWILNGPYSDKTLIRNALMFELSNQMGRYASRVKLVELYINDAYQGMYAFMEKLKRDVNRIDINKLKPDENDGEDLTGGYIIKLDKATGNGGSDGEYNSINSFQSSYDTEGQLLGDKRAHFVYDYPDQDDITNQQKLYIKSYIDSLEDALSSADYRNEISGYRAYINVESFVDFFILNELAHNVDAYRLSTYIVKDKNTKLAMGPIWDFNIALGNCDFCEGDRYDNWMYRFNDYCPWDYWLVHFWWEKLISDPYFSEKINTRWQELRLTILSDENIERIIDQQTELLKRSGAATRNFEKWPVLTEKIWPNPYVGNTYDAEITRLKTWLKNRTKWMDEHVSKL